MERTKDQKLELLERFFRERILPIAQAAAASGTAIFPTGPDPSCETYFINRPSGEDYIHSIDSTDLKGELQNLWRANDPVGMKELAGPIAALAAELKENEPDQDDVSPFIYAMF